MTLALREATEAHVEALLRASLDLWRIDGSVARGSAGGLVVRTGTVDVHVSRAPPGLPFRWIVTLAGRERGSGSVVGLLRHVRQALDIGYRPARLRIATPPEPI